MTRFAFRKSALLPAALLASGILTGLAASSAHAQYVYTPNANASTEASTGTAAPFQSAGLGGQTFQFVFAASQFGAVPVNSTLTSLGFRLDGGQSTVLTPLTFTDYRITLSQSAQPFPTLSRTFTANIGAGATLVRSGALVVAPGSLVGGTGPNPFYDIAFSTPYTYTGGDVLVTFTNTGNQENQTVIVDAGSVGDGQSNTVGGSAYQATTGFTNFFNYPIARFGVTPAVTPAAVPEPSEYAALGMAGLSLCGLMVRARRKKPARAA